MLWPALKSLCTPSSALKTATRQGSWGLAERGLCVLILLRAGTVSHVGLEHKGGLFCSLLLPAACRRGGFANEVCRRSGGCCQGLTAHSVPGATPSRVWKHSRDLGRADLCAWPSLHYVPCSFQPRCDETHSSVFHPHANMDVPSFGAAGTDLWTGMLWPCGNKDPISPELRTHDFCSAKPYRNWESGISAALLLPKGCLCTSCEVDFHLVGSGSNCSPWKGWMAIRREVNGNYLWASCTQNVRVKNIQNIYSGTTNPWKWCEKQ